MLQIIKILKLVERKFTQSCHNLKKKEWSLMLRWRVKWGVRGGEMMAESCTTLTGKNVFLSYSRADLAQFSSCPFTLPDIIDKTASLVFFQSDVASTGEDL